MSTGRTNQRTSCAKARNMVLITITLAFLLAGILAGCSFGKGQADNQGNVNESLLSQQLEADRKLDLTNLTYRGDPYVEVNGNVPEFLDELKTKEHFESYGPLDKNNRCTYAIANLSMDTAPLQNEQRGDISMIHPSGWKSHQGWERCHLIAWMLADENANECNLITGSHYLNTDGMLPFEIAVGDYIRETGNHVLYEVIPVYQEKNLIASGVHMQAESVEDKGKGISFNVYCFNVSPGQTIDYVTGDVRQDRTAADYTSQKGADARTYVLNTSSMKFHYPSCQGAGDIADHNKQTVVSTRAELIEQGYSPCGRCEP